MKINYNIVADDNDEHKELWVDTDVNITIGSDESTVIIGHDLQVDNNIIADADKIKEILKDLLKNFWEILL